MLDILRQPCYSYLCKRQTGAKAHLKSHSKLSESF
ncbi:hypothetical protein [Enterococcus phage vB_Efs10_KEN05]